MDKEARKSLRSLLNSLKKEGLVLETDKEVDPKLEMTALQKRLDGGPPIRVVPWAPGRPWPRQSSSGAGGTSVTTA